MAARITKYLNKYVRRGICLIYMSSFTGSMEWSTGNSYQAEALTNVLRYHTCRSSHPEDRKLPITELKWDARTVTDIPGNTAYWFFVSGRSKLAAVQPLWLNFRTLPVSRIAWHTCIIPQNVCTCLYFMKLPITELKWDARTVTDIPGNTAYWFFVFFWQTKGSRNKN
jgi:uncharacterized protein (DUF3820 family)